MAQSGTSGEIKSEARGPHWIAWILRDGASKPDGGVVFIGRTQEEAEARARQYAESPFYPSSNPR
jgi:hypothetical protein